MKKLLFAIAGAAVFSAFAADPDPQQDWRQGDIDVLGFENFDLTDTANVSGAVVNRDDTGVTGTSKWSCSGDDASLVKAYGGDNATAPSITEPDLFASQNGGDNYLALDTSGSELQRTIPNGGTSVAATGTYIDTLVQFTPSESAPTTNDLTGAKLAIWLGVENNVTNLCVAGDYYWNQAGMPQVGSNKVYRLSGTYEPSTWYRLTVEARDISNDPTSVHLPGFIIRIDGDIVAASEGVYDSSLSSTFAAFTVAADKTLLDENKFIPAMNADFSLTATLTSVGFKGTGALDDFVVTTEAPDFTSAAIDFSLTWPAGLTAVSYQIGEGEPVAISGASPLAVPGLVGGETVKFIVQNADGAQKTLTATAADGEGIDATGTTFGWPEYLGDAVDGAYEIDNLAELKLFQKGIAITTNELKLATAGETFKLTADIALDEAWPGVGVQNGKDIYSTAGFNAAAFQGTFDGQNHTISGFQMIGKGDKAEGLDYCGFFNSAYGATIQNLKIAYAGSLFAADTTASTKESGATFVGVAKNSTLRNLTTVAGTVSCSKGFGGIVGYLTSGTTVDSCTNNVNMTSLAPNKCGGIAMITQNGDAVTISNCQNNGTIAGSSETGSLVGFVGLNTTFTDCDSTVAYRLFHHNSGTVTVSGIKGNATVVSYSGTATPGLNFATVSGSGATFVADDAFALNGAYKVMAPATATFAFAEAGTISFDTNLVQAVTFAITAGAGLEAPTSATANGVVTFTAVATPVVVNVTVTGGANATAAWTVAGESVGSAPTTITEGQTWSVTLTADTDYEFDGSNTYTTNGVAGATDFTIELPDATAQSSGGGDYVVEIADSDVTITPQPGDLEALQAAIVAGGGTLDVTDVAAVNAALAAPIGTTGIPSWQALFLGVAPTEAGLESFKVDSITFDADGNVVVALPDNVDPKTGRGVDITIKLMGSTDLTTWTEVETAGGSDNKTFAPVAPGSGETKKFYKVVVDFAGSSN